MTTPPDIHEDLLEAAKIALATYMSGERTDIGWEQVWLEVAKAVAAYLLSRPPTEDMVRANHGALKAYLDAVPKEERAKRFGTMPSAPNEWGIGSFVRRDEKAIVRFTAMQHQRLISYGIKEG